VYTATPNFSKIRVVLEIIHPGRRPPNHASALCTSCGIPNKYDFVIVHQSFACKSHTLFVAVCIGRVNIQFGKWSHHSERPVWPSRFAHLHYDTLQKCSPHPTPPLYTTYPNTQFSREGRSSQHHNCVTMCSDGKPNRITADGCLGHMDWFPGPLRKFPSSSIK